MDITTDSTGYSFNILHEEVSSDDLFPDKTHQHATNTIYKLIESSNKGITVGIEGSWGSGKSTVVEMLKDRILENQNKKTLFFLFDAWAHEGDPLRRIFLESLIAEIDPGCNDKYLTELTEEISCRTKTVEVMTEKKTSKLGSLIFVSAFLVPIGATILSALDYSKLLWFWQEGFESFNHTSVIGMLFSSAPLITLALWGIFGEKNKNNKRKWDFMESDSIENYVQDITEEGERTSIEFEKYFEKILNHALGETPEKKYQKAIIVIDNLDRVGAEHAAAIWSTLQTFFQHRSKTNKNNPDWMDRLWFLVPYDRDGLARIWDKNINESNNDSISELSKSFLSKNFQVITEVPTPVMSAWYDYCVNCVNKSLEPWPKDQIKIVVKTFQRYSSRLDSSPTPRRIHNFVNQVGVLGIRWGGIMSAESIAMYAISRQDYSENDFREQLLNPGLPEEFESVNDAEDIKMELSGMLFGVEKNKGFQLLLGPEIRNAFINGDGTILKKLINEHDEAFWIVWNSVKNEIKITDSHTEDYRIAATQALHDGMLNVKERIKWQISAIEDVWQSTENKWDFTKYDYAQILPLMAELSSDKDSFISWLNKIISKKLISLTSQAADSSIDKDELIQFSKIASYLNANNTPLKQLHYSNLGVNEWAYWTNLLIEEGISLPSVLPKIGVITETAGLVLQNANTTSKDVIATLSNTIALMPTSKEWIDIATTLVSWANSVSKEVGDNQTYDLMLKIYALCNNDISLLISNSIESAAFWKRGNSEDLDIVTNLPILTACVLGASLQNNTQVSPTIKAFWNNENPDVETHENIVSKLKSINEFKMLWELAKDKTNNLAIAIIKGEESNTELYSEKNAILNLGDYSWIKDDDVNIITKLCEAGSFNNAKNTIKSNPLKYDKCLYKLLAHGSSEAKSFVKDIVESLDEESWDESFHKDDYLLNAALSNQITLNHKFTDSLIKHLTSTIEENITSDWMWENLTGLLEKTLDTKTQLLNLTKTYFIKTDDILSDDAFNALSMHISPYIKKLNHELVMDRVCLWLDEKKWDRTKWLIDSKYKTDEKPTESLSSRVNTIINDLPEDVEVTLLENLSTVFNIEIIKDEDEDDSSKSE